MLLTPLISIANAQNLPPLYRSSGNFNFNNVLSLISDGINILFTAFLITAIVFIIIAAFQFLTSKGDSEKINKATRMLVAAAIAIAVALLSTSFEFVVRNFLKLNSSSPNNAPTQQFPPDE